MSKLKQGLFDKVHKSTVESTRRKRPSQRSFHDLDTIKVSFKPSALELLGMYKEIHNLVVKHSAALVPLKVSFAQPAGGIPSTFKDNLADGVPIALQYDAQNLYFFILEFVMDDDAVIQFPMRLDSMYCCGFRYLKRSEDPLEKMWYSFGKVFILPTRLFKNREKSGLSLAYNDFDKIRIFNGVIAKMCYHFREFRPYKNRQDPVAQILKDTLYFMVSEGSRFMFAMALSFRGIQSKSENPVRLVGLMSDLIQSYGDSSRLGVYLWLAFLEKEMDLAGKCLHDPSRFPDLLLAFNGEAEKFFKYFPLIKFKRFDADVNYSLEAFVGQSLYIIKYSCVLVRQAVMRQAGYDRIFPVMIPLSADDVNCYDD